MIARVRKRELLMHTIRSRPRTFSTGTAKDGQQILLGWLRDFIAVLVFDRMGRLVDAKEYFLNIDLRKGLGPEVERTAKRQMEVVRKELGFREGPIEVEPFMIERWNVGLTQFPVDLQEFLEHPDEFSEEDAAVFHRDVEAWRCAGNCVLRWGNDYLLRRDGVTL